MSAHSSVKLVVCAGRCTCRSRSIGLLWGSGFSGGLWPVLRCAMAVPPRLARKMSVLSVDPPAPWAPGQIAAGRAHRPGSRRLGGVEAPGASPATGASWPDRRKGWASPGRGPVLPVSRVGCVDSGSGALTSSVVLSRSWGRGLGPRARGEATATRADSAPESRTVLPFFLVNFPIFCHV